MVDCDESLCCFHRNSDSFNDLIVPAVTLSMEAIGSSVAQLLHGESAFVVPKLPQKPQ